MNNIADDLVIAFNDGYEKGKSDAEAYIFHCGDPKPKTNADRIRAMTDEALAEWLKSIRYSWTCVPRDNGKRCADFKDDCNDCWLNWLKQEVE